MEKPRYIGAVSHGWQHTDLIYEYRGHQYIVTKSNNGYVSDSLRVQHEEAQRTIDATIEHQNRPIEAWKYAGSSEEGFDTFWDYVNKE